MGCGRRLRAALVGLVASLAMPAGASALYDSTPLFAGPAPVGTVTALERSGSRLYVGGEFTRLGTATGPAAQFSATDGVLGTGLPPIAGGLAQVRAIASDGAGGWYIGGQFLSVGGVPVRSLAHVLADGTVDSAFQPAPERTDPFDVEVVTDIVVAGGRIYVAGQFDRIAGVARRSLAALSPDGSATAFDARLDDLAADIAVSGSTVYAGGFFGQAGGLDRQGLVALDATTGDGRASFDAELPGDSSATSIRVAGGRVWAGGNFAQGGTPLPNGIASLDPTTGDPDPGFDPDCGGAGVVLAATADTVYASQAACTELGGQPFRGLAKLGTQNGSADASFDPGLPAPGAIAAVLPAGPTLYVAGAFASIGGEPRRNLAAISDATGNALAPTFDPDGTTVALARDGDELYAGGAFATVAAVDAANLAAIDLTTGKPDPAFTATTDDFVSSLEATHGRLYVGGLFDEVNGVARDGLAAVDPGTGTLEAFAPEPTGRPFSPGPFVGELVSDDTTLYAGGSFATMAGQRRDNVAAFSPGGGLVPGFAPNPDAGVDGLLLSGSASTSPARSAALRAPSSRTSPPSTPVTAPCARRSAPC